MAVCGVPEIERSHIIRVCLSVLSLRHYMNKINALNKKLRLPPCQLDIGLYSGSVIAGVVGKSKFTFDLWGGTVNCAKRTLETCNNNEILVSEYIAYKAKEYFEFEEKGLVAVKNMSPIKVFHLKRLMEILY